MIAAERSLYELLQYFDAIVPPGYKRSEVSRTYIDHHASKIKAVLDGQRRELFVPTEAPMAVARSRARS